MPTTHAGDRLIGWASIGAYIGRDARSAQRYERDRNLPVHRLPGESRSTVYAFRSELESWLRGQIGEAVPDQQPAIAPVEGSTSRASRPLLARVLPLRKETLILTCIALCAMITIVGGLIKVAGPRNLIMKSSSADELREEAAAALSGRTSAGLRVAIHRYTQAVVRDPTDANAYAGLANSYNLAPEIIGMAPSDAYRAAYAAAERATKLAPRSPDALRADAFVTFWWKQDVPRAMQEFARATELDPNSALTHQWYGNALGARADPKALTENSLAMSLAPSPAVLIDRGYILIMLGRYAEAREVLDEAREIQPDSSLLHNQLALLARRQGDSLGELREARIADTLKGDRAAVAVVDAGMAAFTKGGRPAEIKALRHQEQSRLMQGAGSNFQLAVDASDERDRTTTIASLKAAKYEHDPALLALMHNPDFAWLRSDTEFLRLAH